MTGTPHPTNRTMRSDMKRGKPCYEAPVVVELGDVARASGASCNIGSAPTAACVVGTVAKNCVTGSIP